MAKKLSKLIKSSKSNDSTLIVAAHLVGILTLFIGPLVIMLVTESENVKKHARAALNFQVVVTIAIVAGGVLARIPIIGIIGSLATVAVWIVNIVFSVMAAMKAGDGQLYKYQITYPFFK